MNVLQRICVLSPAFACMAVAGAQTLETFPNLPVICTEQKNLELQPISACAWANQNFLQAVATSWVRWCRSDAGCTTTGDPTTGNVALWKRFDLLDAELDYVEVCTAPKTPGAPVGGASADCRAKPEDARWSAMKYVKAGTVKQPPPIVPANFQVTPESGTSPLHVTVAWNIPGLTGATPCVASGYPAWAGAKAANSKEEFDVYEDAAFTLQCADVDTRHVLITWKPPTLNSDGSVLTNLMSYTLNYGNTMLNLQPALTEAVTIDGKAQHYILENLKPDTWMFGMKSNNTQGVPSALSNIVTYTTTATGGDGANKFSGTRYVKVTTEPTPPSDLAVVEPKAYQLHQSPDQLTVIEFGYVEVGTPCDPAQAALGLFLVKRAQTTPDEGKPLPDVALAKCEKPSPTKAAQWQRGAPLP